MAAPFRPRDVAAMAGLTAAYFVAGKVGLSLAFVNESTSAVWPPTGIAIAALVLMGLRSWPGVAAGAFLVNVTTTGGLATSAGIAAGNTLEALVGAALVVRLAGGQAAFEQARGVFGFVFAVLAAAVVSASVGVTTLLLGGLAGSAALGDVWFTWWLGDAAGGLVVAPLVLTWAAHRRVAWSRAGEGVLVAAAIAGTATLVFGFPGFAGIPVSFLALPPLLWAALRFGPRGAATAAAALSALAIATTLRGLGPFARTDPNDSLLLLQAFLGVATVTSLAVAALVLERQRVEDDLRAARDGLEVRVVERTASLTKAMEALQRSQALMTEAERIASLGSWEWDIPADRVIWSPELYRIYGLDPSKFPATYEGFLTCVHPEDRAVTAAAVRRAFETHQPFEFEHRIVRPDGEVRSIHARGAVTLGPEGRPVRMAGTGLDITARKRAAEALEQLKELERLRELDQFKTQFLNVAAHELSTPLTPIQLQLEVLRDAPGPPLSPAQRRSLDMLDRNVVRLAALVRDILEAARMQAGRLRVRPQPCDLRALAAEAVENFRAPGERAGLEFHAVAAHPLPVEADPARIHQVLLNLLANARKFTPAGGRITVEVDESDGAAVVRVRDTGAGLRAEDMPRLFEPFSQVHEDQAKEGTGLGLFISRGIVEAHGGRLWAESDGPGRGATFTFTLPMGSPSRPPQAADAAAAR